MLFVSFSDTSVSDVQISIKYVYISIYVLYESEKGHFKSTTELDKPQLKLSEHI